MKKVITIVVGTMLVSSLAMAGGNMGRYQYKANVSYDAQKDEFVECRRSSGITVSDEVFSGGLVGIGSPVHDSAVQQKVRDCMTEKGYALLTDNEVNDVCMIEGVNDTLRLSPYMCIYLW